MLTCCTGRLVCLLLHVYFLYYLFYIIYIILFIFILFVYFACVRVSHGMYVEVRGQLVEAGFPNMWVPD